MRRVLIYRHFPGLKVTFYNCFTYANFHPSRFSLTIRQQPGQARISATNERDRRPVDPPPILQIKLEDATSRETQQVYIIDYNAFILTLKPY